MAYTDSRLGPGTLEITFGMVSTPVGCQMSNVRLVPEHDEEDGTPLLCDPEPSPQLKTSWSLQGTAVQDWEDDAGFIEQCRLHNGEPAQFTWTPSTTLGVTYTGTCQVRAVEFGGDVATQLTTDFEFPVVGDIVRTNTLSGERAVITTKDKA